MNIQMRNKVTTNMTIEVDNLYTSRFISNKMIRLDVSLNGTNEDLINKATTISSLTNEMFKQFSEISSQVSDDNED